VDDTTAMSATDLFDLNRHIQGSPTVRLLATLNLGVYATLMERHLSGGVIGETDLVVRLERDLDELGRPAASNPASPSSSRGPARAGFTASPTSAQASNATSAT
jgi:hypothetical protein